MALSFTEKRKVQAIIEARLADLGASGISFSAKRAMQKELEDAFAKLNEQIDLQPDAAQQNQKLADLIAGKFNDLEPIQFLKTLKEITDEIQAVDPVKEPSIKYIETKKGVGGDTAVTESAVKENGPDASIIMESSQLVKDVAAYRQASPEDRVKLLPGIRKGIRGLATSNDPEKETILKDWSDINAAQV